MKVLCIDDAPDILEVLNLSLKMRWPDVEVFKSEDGPTALALFERENPDLLIVDLGLPGMDGYTVASRLRETGRPAVLIALTGYGQDEYQRRSEAAGFDHHLVKPVDLSRLREILAGAGASRVAG